MDHHEHGKKVLEGIGSMHSPEHEMEMEVGHHHEGLGNFEKKAIENKGHYSESL